MPGNGYFHPKLTFSILQAKITTDEYNTVGVIVIIFQYYREIPNVCRYLKHDNDNNNDNDNDNDIGFYSVQATTERFQTIKHQ